MVLLIICGVIPTPSAGPADTPPGRGLIQGLSLRMYWRIEKKQEAPILYYYRGIWLTPYL